MISITKLLVKKFFVDELGKFKSIKEKKRFIEYFITTFNSDYEEYLNEVDGWQIFSDSLGNLDIWENGKVIKSLYQNKDGNYIEPSKFIVKLIDFAEKNYKTDKI